MYTLRNDQQMLPLLLERSWKPHVETAPNCPRCASSNTKFCYYNNYSFSQPRYFCKGCRRYWTKGGSLRNVPVGGGCRKSRRSTHKSSSSVRLPSITTARYSHKEITCQASNTDSIDAQDSDSIDLAAVFAKFLNHNSSSDDNNSELEGQELADSGNLTCKVVDDHCGGVVEGQEPSDLGMDCQLEEVVSVKYVDDHNLLQQQESVHELTRPDEPNLFGLDALMSDQVAEDALWSDATALPSLTWQPMVQFQEFDQALSWNSSFDLSSYELFSRP